MNSFEVKATYEKTLENGMQKKVTEPYLVDAQTLAESNHEQFPSLATLRKDHVSQKVEKQLKSNR